MAIKPKQLTISVTLGMEAALESVKKKRYDNIAQNEIIRQLMKIG